METVHMVDFWHMLTSTILLIYSSSLLKKHPPNIALCLSLKHPLVFLPLLGLSCGSRPCKTSKVASHSWDRTNRAGSWRWHAGKFRWWLGYQLHRSDCEVWHLLGPSLIFPMTDPCMYGRLMLTFGNIDGKWHTIYGIHTDPIGSESEGVHSILWLPQKLNACFEWRKATPKKKRWCPGIWTCRASKTRGSQHRSMWPRNLKTLAQAISKGFGYLM